MGEFLSPLEFELIIEVHGLALYVVGQHLQNSLDVVEGRVTGVDGLLQFGNFLLNVEIGLLFVGVALLLFGFLLLLVLFVGPE